jgi:ABC-type antimicrobial peptide transport system permease subunit
MIDELVQDELSKGGVRLVHLECLAQTSLAFVVFPAIARGLRLRQQLARAFSLLT